MTNEDVEYDGQAGPATGKKKKKRRAQQRRDARRTGQNKTIENQPKQIKEARKKKIKIRKN